jgi:hypothetical protein
MLRPDKMQRKPATGRIFDARTRRSLTKMSVRPCRIHRAVPVPISRRSLTAEVADQGVSSGLDSMAAARASSSSANRISSCRVLSSRPDTARSRACVALARKAADVIGDTLGAASWVIATFLD